MKTPAISIITIVYNGMPYLKECVESVLAQSVQEWELLISDDGSKDGSRNYLDSLPDDPRIRIFKQEKNLGIFGNLNFLFQMATAPLCQILCQDDYFSSQASLQTILGYWRTASQHLGFVRFNHRFEKTRNLVSYEKRVVPAVIKRGEADIWFYIFGNIPGNLSNVSLRTSVVERCGWFDQSLPFAGDFEFWSRAARKVDMGTENALVVQVRNHAGQASHYLNYNGELIAQKVRVINEIYNQAMQKFPRRFTLKILGTFNYDSLERDMALKSLFKGNRNYMSELNANAKFARYTFSSLGRWLLYLLSAGGRIGRVLVSKYLLEKEVMRKINQTVGT